MPKQTFFNLKEDKRNKIIHAAIDVFAENIYEHANLSDIIKKAKIPRGSFYQYFEDKKDLYLFILDLMREKKLTYLNPDFTQSDLPVLDLVEKLYIKGVDFALDYPKYVSIFDKLLNNKNQIYDEIMKDNIAFAIQYYAGLIERDKERNLISHDIDTYTLAKLISNLTTNVTLENLGTDNGYTLMKDHIHHLLYILKKGIEKK